MKRSKAITVSILVSALTAAGLSGIATGMLAPSAEEAVEPDHKVVYYVQGYKGYGANNSVESVALPSGIGIKTLPETQYNTNNRFNDSRNDNNPFALHPESQTGGYGGDGGLWGIYYFDEIQHDSYGSAVVEENDPLFTTPFKSVVSTGAEDWGANQPIIYKFEMPDTVKEYDVVIGANASVFEGVWWGAGSKRTNEVFINAETVPAASYNNTIFSNYTEIHNVKAVEEECVDGVTRNILTITVKAAAGGAGPAVSFVSIADESSAAPAYLSSEGTVVNLDVKAEALPATIEVLTTAGEKSVPVRWTDTENFDNSLNRYLLNTVEVTGVIDVSGFEYTVTVPVQFIKENVYYYMNATDTNGQPVVTGKTFAAMKAANEDTMLNDKMFREASEGVWGGVSGTYGYLNSDSGWMKQSLYTKNPYASLHKTDHTEALDGETVRAIKYQFTDLPKGKYTISVGTREPDNWGGSRTMKVYANGEKLGDFKTAGYTNSLSEFVFEQTEANALLELAVYGSLNGNGEAEDVFVGLVVISEYEEPTPEINYGEDTEQMYFLNAGDGSSTCVSGIGRPYYQTSMSRAFNAPGGGEVLRDEAGLAWGYYYNENMAEGYYASAGNGRRSSPFDSMMFTNIDAANREMIFKFEMPDAATKYDVVIGFSNTWSVDNGNNRGAKILFNHSEPPAALVTNLGYNKAVHFGGITAAASDEDTGLENILTVSLQKPNSQAGSEPTVSFISIRKSGKDAVYIPGAEIAFAVDKNAAALPARIDVLTTAGSKAVDVTWSDTAAFDAQAGKYFLNSFEVVGAVVFGEKTYNVTAKGIYVDTANAYYYIDTTIVDENGNTFLAPVAQAAFDAMKANGLLINDKADAKAEVGSWGNTNVNDTTHYYGYDANPYRSLMESTEVESGLNYLMYSFSDLSAGDYLIQIGAHDPWGPRPGNVMINGASVGTFTTETGKDVMMSFMFTQVTEKAEVKLDITGVDGQLAGFIVIRKIDASSQAKSISISTNAHDFFFKAGEDISVEGLSILVDMGDYTYIRTVTREMISGYDANRIGKQTVTITYAGKTASYDVTVTANASSGGDKDSETKGGCGSSLGAGAFVSMIAVFGCAAALLLRVKNRKTEGKE